MNLRFVAIALSFRVVLRLVLCGCWFVANSLRVASVLAEDEFDRPPISYSQTPAQDRIQLLQDRIDANQVQLEWSGSHGWLPSLLKALEVPVESQTLVFSKTSLQIDRISPQQPRALYFNDDIYIGFVQDSPMLELASIDPDDGAVFYTLHQDPE